MSRALDARRPGPTRTLTRALLARPGWTLVTTLLLLYLPWIGALPLDGTLEGNRLEAAREMLRSGDWIVPHLGGVPYLAKPPLHPWTLALSAALLGDVSLVLGRVVSAASALATCWLVWRFGRAELGRRAGLLAALLLGTSALVLGKALRAELECLLLFWTTGALLMLHAASECPERARRRRLALGAGLLLGAALLTKGPPPLLVFLATAGALALRRTGRRAWLASAALALLPALLLCLAWILPACAALGLDALRASLRVQFTERIVQAGRTNAEPFWYYLPALLGGLAPGIALAPCLWCVRPSTARAERTHTKLLFLWAWALLPCVLFSVSSGKESRYLLPVLPAWALLLAWGWRRARSTGSFARLRGGLARTLARASWFAPLAWLVLGCLMFPEARLAVSASSAALLAARALLWHALASGKSRSAFLALASILLATKFAWAGTALERRRSEAPVVAVADAIRARLRPDEGWILLGSYRSWWHFSVDRPCRALPAWPALGTESVPERLVLAPSAALGQIPAEYTELGRWTVAGDELSLLARP